MSGEDDDASGWIPYRDRPDWSDVKPLKQDDGPAPVAKIAYSDKFIDIYDYFRAIVCSGEVSERALALTKDAIDANSANYSVWHHRRHLLRGLKSDLGDEMEYCRSVMEESPKNYQVWQHRRALVEWSNDPSRELRLTDIILNQDAKNYHAWQHRHWVVQTYQLFENELNYIESMLKSDIRNNSAWNQRFFVVTAPGNKALKEEGGGGPIISGKVLNTEIEFALKAITLVPWNESSWNYLRGIIDHAEESAVEGLKSRVLRFCQDLAKKSEQKPSPYMLAMMVDLHREVGGEENCKKAFELCSSLASEHDVIRKEYWEYTADLILQKS